MQVLFKYYESRGVNWLDNLKLGYGGTKEEMQRLIDDANKVKEAQGETADLTIESYADVVEAIHTVQTEMGITGTTAKEAEGTISGSIAMTKSAWENLMSGLAQDNANIPELVSNVVSSGAKVLENIIPVAKEVLKNIPVAISEISPEAGAAFQTIIDICIGAFDILTAAIKPTFELVSNIFGFLTEHTWVLTAIATAIGVVATAVGMYNVVAAVKAAMAAAEVTTVWALVAAYAAQAAAMIAALAPYLAVAAAIAAVIAVGVLLYKNWDKVVAKAKELYTKVKKFFSDLKDSISDSVEKAKAAAINKFNELKTGAVNKANELKTNAINKFNELKSGAVQKLADLKNGVVQKFNDIKSNISDKIAGARDAVKNAIEKIKGFFNFSWSLPKIKLPHFKIKGKFSLDPPSIPKFSVDWYSKAMNNAMLLNSPTIFGYSGASGKFLGGGEAGSEVVAGAGTLMNMIQNAVSEQNASLADVLYKILNAILAMDENMGGSLREALDGVSLDVNHREFARLVKAVN